MYLTGLLHRYRYVGKPNTLLAYNTIFCNGVSLNCVLTIGHLSPRAIATWLSLCAMQVSYIFVSFYKFCIMGLINTETCIRYCMSWSEIANKMMSKSSSILILSDVLTICYTASAGY